MKSFSDHIIEKRFFTIHRQKDENPARKATIAHQHHVELGDAIFKLKALRGAYLDLILLS